MAKNDESTRAKVLALRAPSQMRASSYIPASSRPNPLAQMQGTSRPMMASPFIPTGGRPNPLAGMMTGGQQQALPFPNQGMVRPTFPTPPVYPKSVAPTLPAKPPSGAFRPLGPGSFTDAYYGSPLDQKNENLWRETWAGRLQQPR